MKVQKEIQCPGNPRSQWLTDSKSQEAHILSLACDRWVKVLCVTSALAKGRQRTFSNLAELGSSGWRGRGGVTHSSIFWTVVTATCSKTVHFTEEDVLDLNYSADLHCLERYLCPVHVELEERSWITFMISMKVAVVCSGELRGCSPP